MSRKHDVRNIRPSLGNRISGFCVRVLSLLLGTGRSGQIGLGHGFGLPSPAMDRHSEFRFLRERRLKQASRAYIVLRPKKTWHSDRTEFRPLPKLTGVCERTQWN